MQANLSVTMPSTNCGKRRVDPRARVHDQDVAAVQELGNVGEARVMNRLAIGLRDEQPYLVTLETACLWWLLRRQIAGQLEVNQTVHSGDAHTAVSSRIAGPSDAAVYRPFGKSPSSRLISAGTRTSGSGRSLMSSQGNAA